MTASCSLPTAYDAAMRRLEQVKPEPLMMAKWLQFAQFRLQHGRPTTFCYKPRFSFEDYCEGNHGFCHAPATHLVGLVDHMGASFRAVHFERGTETPWVCEMSADPNDGLPVYMAVCEAHQQPFSDDPSPNVAPIDASLE